MGVFSYFFIILVHNEKCCGLCRRFHNVAIVKLCSGVFGYTPEMNLIEQIWKEIRKRGFRNEIFATLEKVVDRLCDTICSLSNQVISSITGRDWIIEPFN